MAEPLPSGETLDAVFVSVGGGGSISGVAAALKARYPTLTVVGCWSRSSDTQRDVESWTDPMEQAAHALEVVDFG